MLPGISIETKQMKFQPEELSVQKGDTVVFTNHDLVNHDIAEAAAVKWSSSILAPEHSWKMVVTQNSDYYCSIRPVMKGRIRVQ
jgi:plastocyanin